LRRAWDASFPCPGKCEAAQELEGWNVFALSLSRGSQLTASPWCLSEFGATRGGGKKEGGKFMARLSWSGFAHPWSGGTWDAFESLRKEVDHLFSRVGQAPLRGSHGVHPPVNLYETSDGFVLTAELPGMKLEDIQLAVQGNRLSIRGERKISYPNDERTNLHRRERQVGQFRRAFELPVAVDSEKVEASYRNGVLLVKLPKSAAHRPRRIEVQAQ
jgi:HSP20 family protein